MKIFGFSTTEPTAVEVAEQQVAKATERCGRLQGQLAGARSSLTQRKAGAVQAALDHGQDVDEWGDEIASQSATCDALAAALATATVELKAAEQALADAQDVEQRAASVAEIEALQQDMAAPAADLLDALARLLPLARRAGELTLDGKATAAYLQTMELELPQAFATVASGLAQSIESIRSGRGRATLPAAPEAKLVERPAPPVQVGVLPKYSITWTDHAGQTRTSAPFWDQGLPPSTAEKAIAHGIALPSDSAEARKLRPRRQGFAADLSQLVDLDAEHPAPPAPAPERWLRPDPTPRWGDVQRTSGPLSSWIGSQSRPTNGGGETF